MFNFFKKRGIGSVVRKPQTTDESLLKWDKRFLDMAKLVASWSKDPSTKVGAVIVDSKRRVVSVGYNGCSRSAQDEKYLKTRDTKLLATLHAESNAIDFAHRDLSGCTIYCTHPCCAPCMARIDQSGITRVVYEEVETSSFNSRWEASMKVSSEIVKDAELEVTKILIKGDS